MSSDYVHGPRGKFGKVHVHQNTRIEPWEQQPAQVTSVSVTTDAMGRTVTSYVTENHEGNGNVRKTETVIEGHGERFDGGGTGMHFIPAPKPNGSTGRAEGVVEKVVSAVAKGLGRQGGQHGANQNGRAGLRGMFQREQSKYTGADVVVPQTYRDSAYRGGFGVSGDEWAKPAGSVYPSGQDRFP